MIGIIKEQIYFEHNPGLFHPESPERLKSIYRMLEQDEGVKKLFQGLSPRRATREEIELIHTSEYYNFISSTSGKSYTYIDPDTRTSEKSFEAALYAVGGVLEGIDRIMGGEYSSVFALVRPPGHHAEKNSGKGFCIFNNIAVGAMYIIERYAINKILIVDWDLHHGNGTQHAFYSDPRVLYFSVHQYPYYPGTGDISETGTGRGEGFNINVPLSAGAGDAEYITIFKRILLPVAELYSPQLLLVSAGFDAYYRDPLGGMQVTPLGFSFLTEAIKSIAEKFCGGKLMLTLEGGYNLEGLPMCVKNVLEVLNGKNIITETDSERSEMSSDYYHVIDRVIDIQKKYWSCF